MTTPAIGPFPEDRIVPGVGLVRAGEVVNPVTEAAKVEALKSQIAAEEAELAQAEAPAEVPTNTQE